MKKLLKVLVVLLVLLMIILPAAWLTIPRWLPAVVKSSLPDGVTLSLSQPKTTRLRARMVSMIPMPGMMVTCHASRI